MALLPSVAAEGFKILNQTPPVPDFPVPALALRVKSMVALCNACQFSLLSSSFSPPLTPSLSAPYTSSDPLVSFWPQGLCTCYVLHLAALPRPSPVPTMAPSHQVSAHASPPHTGSPSLSGCVTFSPSLRLSALLFLMAPSTTDIIGSMFLSSTPVSWAGSAWVPAVFCPLPPPAPLSARSPHSPAREDVIRSPCTPCPCRYYRIAAFGHHAYSMQVADVLYDCLPLYHTAGTAGGWGRGGGQGLGTPHRARPPQGTSWAWVSVSSTG